MEQNKNSESGKGPPQGWKSLTPEQADARRRQGLMGPPKRTGTGLFYDNGDEIPPTHPDHGPMHLIPRQEDGSFASFYYCSREELDDFEISAPPPRRHRRDGFSAERQQVFVEHYRDTASLTDAARLTGISRSTAYNLLNSPDGAAFRAAIEEAGRGADVILEATALERAVNGQEEIVYFQGRRVGVRWKYDNRLLMSLLRARNPLKYAPLNEIEGWLARRGIAPPADVEGALDRLAAAEAEWGRRLPGDGDAAALPAAARAPALEPPAPAPASDLLQASTLSTLGSEPPVQESNSSTLNGSSVLAMPSSRRRPGSQDKTSRRVSTRPRPSPG
jgi:transposase